MNLPRLAISVRQPWAWAIIYAGKGLENRAWKPRNPALQVRGRVAVHASLRMSKDEYVSAYDFISHTPSPLLCPPAGALVRGAIIGSVEVVDVIHESDSPWWIGPRALVLRDPEPCMPIPCSGELGFFEWKPSGGTIVKPAKWMLPAAQTDAAFGVETAPADLLLPLADDRVV